MAYGQIAAADVQATSDVAGVAQLLGKLGYDVSTPADQTAAGLGIAARVQHMIRTARRLTSPAQPPALEIYWFEVTALTADLRQAVVAAFRNKPARELLIMTTRDFGQLDFVLVQKSLAQAATGDSVAISHQLFSVERRHPARVHLRVINRMTNSAPDPFAQFDRIRDAFRLAEWSEDEFNNRNLFSDYFLKHRLPQKSLFPIWDTDFKPAFKEFSRLYHAAGDIRSLPEKPYLDKFILPLVAALGFSCTPPGKTDGQADYLLRPLQSSAKTPAIAGLLVYPWDRPLDRKDDIQNRAGADDVPGIRVVKVLEEHKLPWAIVTNGKDWRLYCAQAHSRATNYYEIDLPDKLEHDDLIAFRYFHLFFRADAFVATAGKPCFLDQLRDGSAAFAKELGDKLRQHIFDKVFPYLAQGFVEYRKHKFDEKTLAGDEFLAQTYDATLTLLYRLLFLLYAESLDLLPVHEPAYAQISLTRLKNEIANHAGSDSDAVESCLKARYTQSDTGLYDRLAGLVAIIDAGSKDHNVPTYNGGLFATSPDKSDPTREARAARFLHKYKVPDFFLARAIDLLARGEDSKSSELVFVDYKSLGVRQLGSVYEGLLMYHVIIPTDDWEKQFQRPGLRVALVPSNKERKSTGSFFTPPHIVKYIVTKTVGPLLDEKFAALEPKLRAAQREYHDQKKYEASRNLPPILRKAEEMVFQKHAGIVHELFDIKVLDMAVGSGHFAVETVDYITDRVLEFLAGFPWNPVQVFIDRRVRRPIIDSLEAQGIKINEDRLTDVNLIKRLVMKRCVYGVDINPMAVELAKVSVWLDSFTIGAPLSFMDHHFRCGNSLIGSSIEELKKLAAEKGGLWSIPMEPLERATKNMETIADLSDVTLTEVHKSAETYQKVLAGVKGYRVLLDCMTAEHFGVEGAANLVTEGADLDLERWDQTAPTLPAREKRWVNEATRISAERRFFHWDIDFPDVFFTTRRPPERRRFDAIVGNPPYDRLVESDLGPAVEIEKAYYRRQRRLSAATAKEMNLWRLFVAQAMYPGLLTGQCGMIVPMGLLADDAACDLRVYLLRNCHISHVEAFPQKDDPSRRVFEEAKLSTTIFIAEIKRGSGENVVQVRCHPGRDVEPDSPMYEELQQLFLEFEPHNCPIPRCSQTEWELAKRTALEARRAQGRLCCMHEVARHYEGEVPQKKPLGIFGCPQDGPVVLRGAHIARYVRQEARQGDELYLVLSRFLKGVEGKDESGRLSHVRSPRIAYQEAAPEDNYRRLIPALVPADQYVGHTLHYIPQAESKYALDTLLAIFASSFSEWFFDLVSSNNHVSQYKVHAFPVPKLGGGPTVRAKKAEIPMLLRAAGLVGHGDCTDVRELLAVAHDLLALLACDMRDISSAVLAAHDMLLERIRSLSDAPNLQEWSGATVLRDLDYLGWNGRYPVWKPDDATVADGRWYSNAVAPPLEGNGAGNIPWDLIARVYPSYPLPGIDEAAWEAAAWEEFCDLLRKNKTKIGNARIRADLTGLGAVANPTGPMKKLQETFLKYHREIRENRAKAAELDFLIDRIVFKLFDLTLDEQKLILSRVGPGRPLPPRRGRKGKAEPKADDGPGLFST